MCEIPPFVAAREFAEIEVIVNKMNTVHLIYPSGPRINTPFAIGRELSERLRRKYRVEVHDPQATYILRPEPGDVLLGHPSWKPETVFNLSVRQKGWRRRLCLQPFVSSDLRQVAHLAPVLPFCDLFLAITGPYWIKTLPASPFRHIEPKVVHVDLAVNREHFPPVKTEFGLPGRRRFVYIGNHPWFKNMDYLNAIAERLPSIEFAWLGSTKKRFRSLHQLGRRDFSEPDARELIKGFDFLLTVGNADANPTTILEAMSWGLIPVCTPQSGYEGVDGIINVPLNDLDGACKIIEQLQHEDGRRLHDLQSANWSKLDCHYNWERFTSQVIDAIESDYSPDLNKVRKRDQLVLTWNLLRSSNSGWGVRTLIRSFCRDRQILRNGDH